MNELFELIAICRIIMNETKKNGNDCQLYIKNKSWQYRTIVLAHIDEKNTRRPMKNHF